MDIEDTITTLYRDKKLTIHDQAIYDLHAGKPFHQQLQMPEIKVVEKLGFENRTHRDVLFQFRLSHQPDNVWSTFFGDALQNDVMVSFSPKAQFSIICCPDELARCYARVKDAIEQANAAYQAAIPMVRKLAEKQDAARNSQKQKEEEHQKRLRDALDALEL